MKLFIQKKLVVFSTVFVMLVSLFANSGIVYAESGDTIVYLTKTGECYHWNILQG